jgi:hypothetical protein
VVIIDIECDLHHLKIEKLKATGHKVIVYGDSEKTRGFDLVLPRPLRAADISESLRLADNQSTATMRHNTASNTPSNTSINTSTDVLNNTPSNTKTLYQLKRWSPKSLLIDVNYSSRLCAALFKGPISSEQLAKAVNLQINDVEMFISSCQDFECVQITYAPETNDTPQPKGNHIALFDRIRRKFSVRSSRG